MSLFKKQQPKHVQTSDPRKKLGRLPNDPTKPRLRLKQFLKSEYSGNVPATVDYLSKVSDWPMYGNDQLGDCTAAAAGHHEEAWSTYGQGTTVKVSDNDVIAFYSASSGYVPGDPSTDNGAVMQDCLNVWRKQGLAGHTIAAFFEVDVRDTQEVKAALYLFGGVYIGINFPTSAMDQFNSNQAWDYNARLNNTIEGGHAIHIGRDDNGLLEGTTWGQRQKVTQSWWDHFVEEAWVPVTNEWIANNTSPEGLDVNGLNAAFTQLTGQPGPFPVSPTPSPTPPPTPAPSPTPDPGPTPTPGPTPDPGPTPAPTPTPTPDPPPAPVPGPDVSDLIRCIRACLNSRSEHHALHCIRNCIDQWLAAGRKKEGK